MSAPAILIAIAKLRPDMDEAFVAWQARQSLLLMTGL